MNFTRGQVVKLKSGGPDMTVGEDQRSDYVSCVWFDGKRRMDRTFAADTLVHVLPPATPSHHEPAGDRA
jgi:uncharacterized protein YodC (DUF2158 family)